MCYKTTPHISLVWYSENRTCAKKHKSNSKVDLYLFQYLNEPERDSLTLNRSPGGHLEPTQVWWQFISVHQVAAPRHLR